MQKVVSTLRSEFNKGKTHSLSFRKTQLNNLHRLLTNERDALCKAVFKDLHKPLAEAELEIDRLRSTVVEMLENLDAYASSERPSVALHNKMDICEIRKFPVGLVLILAPWNFPAMMNIEPLIGAIAAGCAAIIKPSELAVHSSELLAEILPKYLDTNHYKVVLGAIPEATALLNQKFDHIFYTGSTTVGKIVMAAAAKHLTPVTLELGGKSPTFVDKHLSPTEVINAGRRICWGKFMNSAPDYVIVHPSQKAALILALKSAVEEFFGADSKENPDYSRIINESHLERLANTLETQKKENTKTKVELGGKYDKDSLYFAPTILSNVTLSNSTNPIMRSEIFGPILPVIEATLEEGIAYVNSHGRPLALYVFSNNKASYEKVLKETMSGGCCINDVLMHILVDELPFGGSGDSGMGSYHGKRSFDIFTHQRSVMIKKAGNEVANLIRYPPYTAKKSAIIKWVLTKEPKGVVFRFLSSIFGMIIEKWGILGWICAVGMMLRKKNNN